MFKRWGARAIRKRAKKRAGSRARKRLAKYAGLPRRDAFAKSWRALRRDPTYRLALRLSARSEAEDDFEQRTYLFLSAELDDFPRAADVAFEPNVAKALATGGRLMVLQFHQSVAAAIFSSVLESFERPFARIVADAGEYARWMSRHGGRATRALLVERDVTSLLRLAAIDDPDLLIHCLIDHRDATGRYAFASPNMIRFANRLGIPVLFVKWVIDGRGRIRIHGLGPMNEPDPERATASMIEFYNSTGRTRVDYAVRRQADAAN